MKAFAAALGMVWLLGAPLAACKGPSSMTGQGPEHTVGDNSSTHPWARKLGESLTLEGSAANLKLGALLEVDGGGSIWIDGLDSWPEGARRVRVTGTLIERHDMPVFVPDPNEPIRAGIPVPEGTDIKAASHRYLLRDARWELLDAP